MSEPLERADKLVGKLPATGELLRGSVRRWSAPSDMYQGLSSNALAGEGHQVFVLTVTYAGGRTQQFSVRRERVAEFAGGSAITTSSRKRSRTSASSIMSCYVQSRIEGARGGGMIEMRRAQLSSATGLSPRK